MSSCCDSNKTCATPTSGDATHPASHSLAPASATLRYRIQQMDCPTEEGLIRSKLEKIPGIQQLEFNLVQRILTIIGSEMNASHIEAEIRELGFTPEKIDIGRNPSGPAPVTEPAPSYALLGVAGIAAIAAEALDYLGIGHPVWIAALALFAIALSGWKTYQKGWIALKNRNLNINALMSIAVTGAVLIGQFPEAAMVIFLFAIAELIEAKSIARARQAIRGLMDLTPTVITVKQADGSWDSMDVSNASIGDLVRVRPGERIGLDGLITAGQSTVNQAPITGESLPIEKNAGDTVFAGTINDSGSFEFRVTATAQDTTLARIIHAIENAQGARAPTQRFVDAFAKIYTPIVFGLAILIAIIPPLLFGGIWYDWIYKALVLLVIACPCALVISTPVTVVSGLAAAARRGILIKGGVYLENGRFLHTLALDKTGTVTQGKPTQTDMAFLVSEDNDALYSYALSLAARSDHPVSRSLVNAAPPTFIVSEISDFSALPGQGIQGQIAGRQLFLGNHRLIEQLGVCSPVVEKQLEQWELQGKTVVMLADTSRVLMLIAVADAIRPTSLEAIQSLSELGVETIMLTGDNAATAAHIAQQVAIETVHGNQMPDDKLNMISALIDAKGTGVGMVGDGINDAPALARADIAFAMGAAGTDTAIETADVALMDDDLRKISEFIHLSHRTAAILKQNIAAALGIKAVFIVLTLMGEATLWMAVFADVGASLLVVGNGLRLLRAPRDAH